MKSLVLRMRTLRTLAVAGALICPTLLPAHADSMLGKTLSETVAALEERTGGQIGVSVTDVASGQAWTHRANERFPLASTFKAFLCGHLLDAADRGEVDVDQRVRFEEADLESYSPVTEALVGGEGMSLFEACAATTSMSDNTAANIVLRATGGPEALTQFIRAIGDETSRFDRYEPELNDVGPGEVRDTTTPAAAAQSLRTLVLGDALQPSAREQLRTWLTDNEVGGPLLRASLPEGWTIADRTGSGEYGSRGVIAVIWPVEGETNPTGPIVASVYLTGTELSLEERNVVIAEIGAAMFDDLEN